LLQLECITGVGNGANQQAECSIVSEDNFTRSDWILQTLRQLMISKIQRSWRHFSDVTVIRSCRAGLETIGLYALPALPWGEL